MSEKFYNMFNHWRTIPARDNLANTARQHRPCSL